MFFMITFFFSLPSLYASSLSLNSICSRLRNICNYHDAAAADDDDDDDDGVDDDDVDGVDVDVDDDDIVS